MKKTQNKQNKSRSSKTAGTRAAGKKKQDGFGAKDLLILLVTVVLSVGLLLASLVETNVITIRQIEEFLHLTERTDVGDSADLPDKARELSVSMIDVGQGDSILIRAGEMNILIDSGEYTEAHTVERFLKDRHIQTIDILIMTHQHTDHMGGMGHIVDKFDVRRVIMPDAPDELIPPTTAYESFLDAVERKGLHITPALAGYVYKLTDGDDPVTLSILAPLPGNDLTDLNDWSVVARLDHGDISFLFTGDLTENGEKALIDNNTNLSATVLKVGHHGASASSSREFLHRVHPSAALISVGSGNTYGHPSEDTLRRINRYTDRIYRTDLNGNITVYSDGRQLYVEKDR
ncbi:MAG: MBL fold metallo-hydrolase [Oscillospiraceae bacterium]|nr:MBL fold metallo-hydrolase [Oscillospiraceae bacterium]